jgi:putative acetyltransferase
VDKNKIIIRPLQESDNAHLAKIIRDTLTEFGANKPGTVFYDSTTDSLYNYFQENRGTYFIAEFDNKVLGGAGIFPSKGLAADTCELVKMYLLPEARNKGIGKKLVDNCIAKARSEGYSNVYLETMPELSLALKMYEKYGFSYLENRLGNNDHFGCNLWMLLKLE